MNRKSLNTVAATDGRRPNTPPSRFTPVPNPVWLVIVATMLTGGCRPVMEVSGTVQVDGRPSGGVVVMFDPVEPNLPRGVATTDKQGGYVVRRLGPGNKTGIMTGKYAVKLMADIDDPAAAKIPPRYFRGTELEYEVVSGKDNIYDIEVSTK